MATTTTSRSVEQFKKQPRLPKFAVPKSYDLFLKPDLSSCTFAGSVKISLQIVAPTAFVVLNAADLAVNREAVSFKISSKDYKPSEIVAVEEDEILVIGFDEVLPIGDGILTIGFEGTLNDKMKGLYRSVYEHDGEKKNMAVTQFEPADARRCFPCWDEPACKATFKITLEVPTELVALSNMPVVEEKSNGVLKTLTFQESPIMSTYLVAVVVGLFDYVEDSTSDGIKVRVYSQIGKTSQGKFALGVAVKTLDLYKKYFAVPYTLPKLDMIAIPDFAAGAMENYGLVTYRESALLFDDRHSAAANKQRIAVVVAHELAHQWFGNLVTMEWWTHLWLNEGFATWVSYLAADCLFPEWKIWTQFLDETTVGLRLDALTESHPIEVEINHSSEIDEIFDAISYKKGASVIRMLHNYLGAECFQRSLASYIKKFACSNAKTEDLWEALEEESGEPVKMLMDSWTKQKGYPVISVHQQNGKLKLEQTQFLSSGASGDGQWIVPLTFCCGSYTTQEKLLLKSQSGEVDLHSNCSWVKLNVDQTGFYRVKYDDELATGLKEAVEDNLLSATDRFGILEDAFALWMACKQSLSFLLSLLASYKEENEYTVLSQIITISHKVVSMVGDSTPELLNDIKQFFINLFKLPAEKLGWDPKDNEGHLDAMLRGGLLTALAEYGHDATQEEAVRRFNVFLEDRNSLLLSPDIRKAAYVAVMKTVNQENKVGYESLLKIYRETDISQERGRVLSCLASSSDPQVVVDALNFMLSSEVRSQDAIFVLGGISRRGRDVSWIWLKDNWEQISETWGSGFLLSRFVGSIVSLFSSDDKASEIEDFFASQMKPSIQRTLKQSLERVRNNAKLVKSIRNEHSLADVAKMLLNGQN